MSHTPFSRFQRGCALMLAALVPLQGLLLPGTAAAQANLADQPVFASAAVPGNLALALSVEWPTASRTAHTAAYTSDSTFLGYFDPNKCYTYQYSATANSTNTGNTSYFQPAGAANNRTCTGKWSGNFLNWAATAAIDPFRWAMTGGRRVVDTASETILEKGWHSGQGLFGDRSLPANMISGATPLTATTPMLLRVNGMGFRMRFTLLSARNFTVRYWNNTNFNNPTARGDETNIPADKNWGNNAPTTNVNADNFSTRWTGTFTAPVSGAYRFRLEHDDLGILWVDTSGNSNFTNSNRIINEAGNGTHDSGTVNLTAGSNFSVRIDQADTGGGASVVLWWSTPNSGGAFQKFSSPLETTAAVAYNNTTATDGVYDLTMRVKVCDPSNAAGGVETNCKAYGGNYKPEGLVQKYAQDMRYSAFGYLNDSDTNRDGGVLRARQKFVGPSQPVPGQPSVTNAAAEWSSSTGVFVRNPDAADATATATATGVAVSDSGVINYLNQFGQLIPGSYKSNDPVNELFYSVMRYYRNLGNVPQWTNMGTATAATKRTWVDGFPVITDWDDPVQYSCQRNFVLGIGDIYTHRDKNVPGNDSSDGEPAMPGAVSADTTVNAMTATNKVGVLQGVGGGSFATQATGSTFSRSYMAGLAYDANTKDIRPDVANDAKTHGKQTVQTYWVDVLEQPFVRNNKFYLAAKYGGMKVPSNFDPYAFAGTIPVDWWSTNGENVTGGTSISNELDRRPDNYFTAGRPDTMVAGLTRAFENIVGDIKAFTTSFSLAAKQITELSNASYATQYDSSNWSGELTGSRITIDTNGTPLLDATPTWSTATRFENQLAGTGWNTQRRVVTWNPDATNGAAGVPFRDNTISTAQKALLNTTYVANDDSASYLNWLRGDTTLEANGYRARSITLSTGVKRNRLGDIVNSKVTVVAGPPADYSETVNPGYRDFKDDNKNRQTMLYVGANDGMLHAFKGGLGSDGGTELFAYVPSALFYRNPTDATAPTTDGLLAQLGRPTYLHRNYVDSTAKVYDIDFNNAAGAFATTVSENGTTNANWRSVLIGGLGKGGRSYYAIDVTDPSAMTSETAVAGKVLWEFPARNKLPTASGGTCTTNCIDMGYSYGEPIVVKTAKYGWVVLFTSGYNNVGGKGHLFVVNPTNGALLEDISTGETASSGMARPTAYVRDYTDMTADSVYVGDLDGQVWRFDLSAARGSSGGYSAPTRIALLTDTDGNAQPVTSRPLVEIHPVKRKRFVLLGTGRLLHSNDIQDAQGQTFYAIIDGGIASFASQANDGDAWPVERDQLLDVTDPALGVNVDNRAGWRLELGRTGSVGWRVVGDQADAYNGTIGIASFPSVLPTGDACSPSGLSRAYALNYASAKTVLQNNAAYISFNSVITDL
ncbi:MAG: pilus assembly protein [Comamonadaceae bacterium]|nr:MAG: pilus assembly protein [Comamonadaceae bacterium]